MHWSGTPPHKRGDPFKTREEIEADFEKSKKRNSVDKINLIYENKILPILGAIARGVGEAATEVGQGVAEGVKDGMTNDEEKEE
jgi:hypothetical protein